MINDIIREGTKVCLKIDTGLADDEYIEKRLASFSFECNSELYATLLQNHIIDIYARFKVDIARNCHYYLNDKAISKLKSKLNKEWNGKDHCWKWE